MMAVFLKKILLLSIYCNSVIVIRAQTQSDGQMVCGGETLVAVCQGHRVVYFAFHFTTTGCL